ncbi:MAG: hypothetical protein J0M30_08185 [Chitinophagales bacterium]|nr:hypothetical protein [Chitinophagales bacterium]
MRINARTNDILKTFIDSKTGKSIKESEARAAAIFEESTGSVIRVSGKNEAGDFIGTSGKYLNKSIDHIGGYLPDKNNMTDFLSSLSNHFKKADVVILDLKNFSDAERKTISEYVRTNHANDLGKLIELK